MNISHLLITCLAAGALLATGTKPSSSPYNVQQENGGPNPVTAGKKEEAFPVTFIDVAASAGLTEPIIYGGIERKKYIIETNGSGVAFLDYDNDGWVDILLLNGTRLEGFPRGKAPTIKLYQNKRNGSFADVTVKAGLRSSGWGSAICAGDYDNDGYEDFFLTYWGQNVLYRNNGNGTFTDTTTKAGLGTTGNRWGSGCTFVDYDRDGKLDLFVANYLKFDLNTAPEPGKGANCSWKGIPVNCGPKGLPTDTNLLYHNNGDGTFTKGGPPRQILRKIFLRYIQNRMNQKISITAKPWSTG